MNNRKVLVCVSIFLDLENDVYQLPWTYRLQLLLFVQHPSTTLEMVKANTISGRTNKVSSDEERTRDLGKLKL